MSAPAHTAMARESGGAHALGVDRGSWALGALLGLLAIGNLIQGISPVPVVAVAGAGLGLMVVFRTPRGVMQGGMLLLAALFILLLGYFQPGLNPASVDKRRLLPLAYFLPFLLGALIAARWDLRRVNRSTYAFAGTLIVAAVLMGVLVFVHPDPVALASGRRTPAGVNAISAGRVLGLGALASLILAMFVRRLIFRILLLILAASSTVVLLLTASRGPLVGLVAAVLVVLLWGRSVPARVRVGVVLAAAGVGAYLMSKGVELNDRLTEADDTGRGALWAAALEQFERLPAGIGWGNLYNYLPAGAIITGQDYDQYPHNLLLEVGSEAGPFAFLLLAFVLAGAARFALRARTGPELLVLGIFTFALTGAMTSSNMLGNVLLWVSVGILAGSPLPENEIPPSGSPRSEHSP